MTPYNIFTGSSIAILFHAKDGQGIDLDISTYEKKITLSSGNITSIEAEITDLSASSFSVSLKGDETKKLGEGLLGIIIELRKEEDMRIGKLCPLYLKNPKSSNSCNNSAVLNQASIETVVELNSTSIAIELTMGSTIINQGGGGDIPTKLSQLINDEEFITVNDIPYSMQWLIDLWNVACGTYGRYNADSACFELNGLLDLTYEQAIRIYLDTSSWSLATVTTATSSDYRDSPIRTNLPLRTSILQYGPAPAMVGCLVSNTIEVLNLASIGRADLSTIMSISDTSFRLPLCKKIIGNIIIYGSSSTNPINIPTNLPLCEAINLNINQYTPSSANNTINIKGLQSINLASLNYLINSYPAGRNKIVISVHADVYAKLTNAVQYPEWVNLVTIAQTKNITFAL